MKSRARLVIIALLGLCVIALLGCETFKEAAKGVAGISTNAVEKARKDAVKKSFKLSYNACYSKAKGILIKNGSYIYAEDPVKRMIAIYFSEDDTTPVGIFFKKIDDAFTQVEVSSQSTYIKDTIAQILFSQLEGKEDAKN